MENTELFAAIEEGDEQELRRCLAAGADLDARVSLLRDHGVFFDGLTPLIVACMVPGERAWAVRMLMEAGADPFAVFEGEVTALWYAAGGGVYQKSVLEASEENLNWDRQTGDFAERLRLLLKAGGHADETASNGRSALCEACAAGDPERVSLLLEAGTSPDADAIRVEEFRRESEPKIEDLLSEGAADLPIPKRLRKKAFDSMMMMVKGSGGASSFQIPLHAAAEGGSAECIQLLLEAGAHPSTLDDSRRTALFYVASVEAAEVLLQARVDPVAVDQFQRTALEAAFEEERYEVAAVLLKAFGDINRFEGTWNQLHNAAFRIQPKAIKALVEAGADPLMRTKEGDTALHLAAWQGDSSWDDERNEAIRETIRLLVCYGLDPNDLSPKGNRPLHEAVHGDWASVPATWELLQLGADPDGRDQNGRTPLMEAAEHGSAECIRVLLAAGADPSLKDRHGRTALSYAKGHLGSWKTITRTKRLFRKALQDYEQKALDEAEECVRLLE